MAFSEDSQPGPSIYTPLDEETRSIRLLRFIAPPSNSEEKLHFTLTVHKLPTEDEQNLGVDHRARFIALSYVWGQTEAVCPIIVNGKRLKIRKNLYALLRVLHTKTRAANRRRPTASPRSLSEFLRESPYLWADAICIDQEASEEKGHQVNMMGDIYLQAECVVSWLGPAADDSKLAGYWLRKAGVAWTIESYVLKRHVVVPLLALLNRPYWQRLWIVQEFVLARRLFLLCGQSVVSMYGTRGEERFETLGVWMPTESTNILAKRTLDAKSWLEHWPGIFDFHYLVHEFRDHGCQNRRDRIFALLALYHEKMHVHTKWEIPRINADYKIAPERLFYRVFADCIKVCDKDDAQRRMQQALDLPQCEFETPENANEIVEDVSGLQDFWRLDENQRSNLQGLTVAQLTQKGIIRERSIEEITGRLTKLTGLTSDDMYRDPEGTYLEVIGRVYNYDIWHHLHASKEHNTTWETFIDALRRTLGMPLVNYAHTVC